MIIDKITSLPEFQYGTIESVYAGKPHACMCGCSGKYSKNDKNIQRVINKIKKNSPIEIEVLDGYIYTVIIGKTQYTIYLKHQILRGD